MKLPIVFGVSMPLVSGCPPIIGAATPETPLPPSPWHATHFSANILAPSTAVPLPSGRPRPSGMAATSQAATSASVIGLPSFGDCASAAPAPTAATSSAGSRTLRVDMLDLPARVDAPAGEAVVMLVWEAERIGRLLGLAARGDELGAQRLHVARFVPSAALDHHRLAVPAPRHAEARERLWMHRPLPRGLRPALAGGGR